MEARNRTIEEWFAWISDGSVALPRFQRYEAWGWSQVESLLESVLRRPSLPVGALLMLEVGDEPPFKARSIVGAPDGGKATYHLLDGQQRMTALWRSLSDDYDDVAYFVAVAKSGTPETPDVVSIRRYRKGETLYPVWCDDAEQVAARDLIPVCLLRPGQATANRSKDWIKEVAGGDMDRILVLNEITTELRSRVATYSLPFLSLPVATTRETALDVFIKMNTQGTALTAFDIVVAQVEADTGTSLHERVEGMIARLPLLSRYGEPSEIALAVGAVLAGRAPNRATYLRVDFGTALVNVWDRIERGLERAITFLTEEGMVNDGILPSDVLVTLMGAYWSDAPDGKDAEGVARRIARRALWRGSFSERYQKTSATRVALDYRELVTYRDGDDTAPLPVLFDEERTPLPEAMALRTGGWPRTKDRLGRAIMAASLRTGGYDFADEKPFSADSVEGREYHHLFPKALLEQGKWPRRLIFCALNCALVSWRTNRTIGAKPPSVYVAERAEEVGLPEGEVDRRLLSHCVPPDALCRDDYEAFLSARADMVHHIMLKLCAGENVGLQDVPAEDAGEAV